MESLVNSLFPSNEFEAFPEKSQTFFGEVEIIN